MYVYVQIYDLPFRNNKKNIKVKVFTNINDAYNELKVSMINDGEVPPSYFDYYGNPIDFHNNHDIYDEDDFYIEQENGVISARSTIGHVDEDPNIYTTIDWYITEIKEGLNLDKEIKKI